MRLPDVDIEVDDWLNNNWSTAISALMYHFGTVDVTLDRSEIEIVHAADLHLAMCAHPDGIHLWLVGTPEAARLQHPT